MSVQQIRVSQVESTRLLVKETGVSVNVRDEVHAKTNHYIEQSRPYFPDAKLPTYIDCPAFFAFARLLCFASLSGVLGVNPGVPKELPMGFFIACAVFFLIYCQHERVNQMSLLLVLKQPVFESQQRGNWFYEVTITELQGLALENYQAGIGYVKLTHGKIKFQAFNMTAVKNMRRARCYSRVMMVLFFATSVVNLFFMVVAFTEEN